MTKRTIQIVIVLAAVYALAATATSQSTDPWVGTWKVNLAKSTYSPGPKPTAAGTVKIEAEQGGFKTTIDGVNAQGQPTHTEATWKFDGKDYPVQGAPTPNSTGSYRRIDPRTFEAVAKVDGKATVTTRVVVSADGKTLTATQTGKSVQGQTVNNVIVLDQQ